MIFNLEAILIIANCKVSSTVSLSPYVPTIILLYGFYVVLFHVRNKDNNDKLKLFGTDFHMTEAAVSRRLLS